MSDGDNGTRNVTYSYGLTGIVAAIVSWMLNHSIGWALVHWLCGFFYIVYAALCRTSELETILRGLG